MITSGGLMEDSCKLLYQNNKLLFEILLILLWEDVNHNYILY
jgi:hypothetical protein